MQIEVSNGEILDKISILYIKLWNIIDADKLTNVKIELNHLVPHFSTIVNTFELNELYNKLLLINMKLWQIEDDIRKKEIEKNFDNEFIELARSVYITNDIRADIKKEINHKTNSILTEVKSYT